MSCVQHKRLQMNEPKRFLVVVLMRVRYATFAIIKATYSILRESEEEGGELGNDGMTEFGVIWIRVVVVHTR